LLEILKLWLTGVGWLSAAIALVCIAYQVVSFCMTSHGWGLFAAIAMGIGVLPVTFAIIEHVVRDR
jgi:hypothetical protein